MWFFTVGTSCDILSKKKLTGLVGVRLIRQNHSKFLFFEKKGKMSVFVSSIA